MQRSVVTSEGVLAHLPLRAWVAGCVGLCLLLRLPFLPAPLGIDEGGTAYLAAAWDDGGGSLYGQYWMDRPPLLLALYALAVPFGDAGVRALGAVAALTLVVLGALLARALAGDGAARVAALLVAVLASSPLAETVFTTGELLAAVPAAAGVLLLLRALRTGGPAAAAGAAALAVVAALVKQSQVHAAAAVGVGLVVAVATRPSWRSRRGVAVLLAAAVGGVVPLAATAAWALLAGVPGGELLYALTGFRADVLAVLDEAPRPLRERAGELVRAALVSGLVLLAGWCVPALLRLWRRDRSTATAALAWVGAALVGVLGGGYYWPHYLGQLVVPVAVLASVGLVRTRPAARSALLGVVLLVGTAGTADALREPERYGQRRVLAVAEQLRADAVAGDSLQVLYARANLLWYARLPAPYAYQWSAMLQAVPGAHDELLRLLEGPDRPTWVVQWQRPGTFGLDARRLEALLAAGYRPARQVCGVPVLLRSDRQRPLGPPVAC